MPSIVDVLQELGVPYRDAGQHHHVTRGWLGVDCPYCSPESGKFKLGINLVGLFASCWTCGARPVTRALADVVDLPERRIRELLADVAPAVRLPEPRRRGKLVLPVGVGPLLPAHEAYLRARGFDPDALARLWGVRGIGLDPRVPWRVFVPITLRGEIVSWTARAISDRHPLRYVNAAAGEERVSAKTLLFGADHARHAVVVVEGPFDAMRIGPGAVATMGVSYSRAQLRQLARFPVRAVCFDAVPDAQRRARRLCADLAAFPGRTDNVALLTGKDAADAKPSEIRAIRRLYLD